MLSRIVLGERSLFFRSNVFHHTINRRYCVHPYAIDRYKDGEFNTTYIKVRNYPQKFRQYLRMSPETFHYILAKYEERYQPSWTNFVAHPITAEERLVITLRFLATGRSFHDLALTFKLGLTTVRNIIYSTVEILWDCLHPIHLKVPTEEDFKRIAEEFYVLWGFPNTIGAIDGKHIRVKCPPHSGTMFYNYKHYFSIVLQAIADAKGKFVFIEVGVYGKQSDGGTFRSSSVFERMESKNLNIPPDDFLPGTRTLAPFVFIGDEAYPLLRHLLKSYSRQNLNDEKETFNKRFSRARRIVECAFGIMTAKWRILTKEMETRPNFCDKIVKCICALHNTIIDMEGRIAVEEARSTGSNLSNENNAIVGRRNNRATNEAIKIRESFKTFVLNNPLIM